MNEPGEHERQVRRFLLGQVEEQERQQLEQTVMVNAEYREQVQILEEILIEDYLDGVLPPDEQQAFETYFLATDQQRLRVQIAREISSYGARKLSNSSQQQPPIPPPRRWYSNFGIRNHPVVFTSLAAVLLVIVSLAVVQGIRIWREQAEILEASQRHSDIERELVRLNSTPAQNLTDSTLLLTLAPVSLRDASDASTLPIPLPAGIVEVRLILSEDTYSSYAVELNKIGAAEKFNVESLHTQGAAGGQVIIVRLPSHMLSRGEYRLSLFGLTNDNQKTNAGEYHFRVGS